MSRRIAVFYHVWAPAGTNIWNLLVDEQLKRVQRAGLVDIADIFCCISGPQFRKAYEFISTYDWVNILEAHADQHEYEGLTLKHLFQKANERAYDSCCYFHTKGLRQISDPDCQPQMFRSVNSWRHMMESIVLDRWTNAIPQLNNFDAVGTNFRHEPWPHFGGNFWWASASYLRGLPHPISGQYPPFDAFPDDELLRTRTNYERWIGIGQPKICDFLHRDIKLGGGLIKSASEFPFYIEDIAPLCATNMY